MERVLPRGERLLLGVEGEGVDWPWESGVGVLMREGFSECPEGRGPGSETDTGGGNCVKGGNGRYPAVSNCLGQLKRKCK